MLGVGNESASVRVVRMWLFAAVNAARAWLRALWALIGRDCCVGSSRRSEAVTYLCGALACLDEDEGSDMVRLDLLGFAFFDLADSPKATRLQFCDTSSEQ